MGTYIQTGHTGTRSAYLLHAICMMLVHVLPPPPAKVTPVLREQHTGNYHYHVYHFAQIAGVVLAVQDQISVR